MTEPTWLQRPSPPLPPGASLLGRWRPTAPADLTAHRRELAAALHDGRRPPGVDEQAVECLLLLFEELVSNALRHGSPPVVVELHGIDHCWLLDVSDAAVDRPPSLAVGRDAALGGLGLYLVALLSGTHGWTVVDGRKHVWAFLDRTRAVDPASGVPRPRDAARSRTDGRQPH
jgi:hypothetical protein